VNGIYAGFITVSDTLKEDSADAIAQLKSNGIRTFMLTGDNKKTALDVANSIGIDEVRYELLPQQKAEALEEIMSRYKSVVFAGDGINDAPVLKIADIGIAMGRSGADAAVESSDVTLLGDQPTKIWEAVKISRITKSIIVQNMIFIFAIKGVVLLLSALGFANMWEAVFADVGTAVLAVLNSLRILSRSGRI
jgi:Cd2+/Zn2+-exporting ATPase